MTSTRFVAAESSDPKQRVGIASPHLEEKILQVFFALPVSGALGPGLGGREARRKAGCHAPGCPDEPRAVQMNPCPPQCPSPAAPQSGGRSPAASLLWACSKQVKMATATLSLDGSSFCVALPGRPGAPG